MHGSDNERSVEKGGKHVMEKEQEFYKQDMEMLHRLCMIKQLGGSHDEFV